MSPLRCTSTVRPACTGSVPVPGMPVFLLVRATRSPAAGESPRSVGLCNLARPDGVLLSFLNHLNGVTPVHPATREANRQRRRRACQGEARPALRGQARHHATGDRHRLSTEGRTDHVHTRSPAVPDDEPLSRPGYFTCGPGPAAGNRGTRPANRTIGRYGDDRTADGDGQFPGGQRHPCPDDGCRHEHAAAAPPWRAASALR